MSSASRYSTIPTLCESIKYAGVRTRLGKSFGQKLPEGKWLCLQCKVWASKLGRKTDALVRIDLRDMKLRRVNRKALGDGVHREMVEALGAPAEIVSR